jgi:hypothetical protein
MDFDKIQYDMSAVATTESEMKVPPSLAFVENAPVTRSVGVMGADIHSGFGDASMEAPAQYDADDWGYSFNESSFAPTKLSSSDDFNPSKNFGPESLMPSKLSSSDAFNPIKGGNVGFSSPMVFQESVQPRALEPEPIYFEKYSSFVSTSSPSAVLADIANVFAGVFFVFAFVRLGEQERHSGVPAGVCGEQRHGRRNSRS